MDFGLERDVLQPVVTFQQDHVRFDFPPAGGVLAVRRHILVPYSTVRDVRVEEAPWPSVVHFQRVGTHLPGVACLGTFWVHGEKRFYFFLKGDRVVTLDLEDHPYARLVIGSPEPDVLAADVKSLLSGSRGSETQSF